MGLIMPIKGRLTREEVHMAVVMGKKVNAIKLVRTRTGLGLKETKDLVDEECSMIATHGSDAYRPIDEPEAPEQFVQEVDDRDRLAEAAPIPFEVVERLYASSGVDPHDAEDSRAFMAFWARLRYDYAEAMIRQRDQGPEAGDWS